MAEEKQTTDYRSMALGDPEEPGAAPIATTWIKANEQAVAEATKPETIAACVATKAAAAKLLALAKTGYQTDALAALQMSAATQYVMASPAREKERRIWTEALIDAATKAHEVQLIMFYVDLFRWCGYPDQLDAMVSGANHVNDLHLEKFLRQLGREVR